MRKAKNLKTRKEKHRSHGPCHSKWYVWKRRLENTKARVTSIATVADRKAKSPTTPDYRTLVIEMWWRRVNESARHSDNTAWVSVVLHRPWTFLKNKQIQCQPHCPNRHFEGGNAQIAFLWSFDYTESAIFNIVRPKIPKYQIQIPDNFLVIYAQFGTSKRKTLTSRGRFREVFDNPISIILRIPKVLVPGSI